MTDREKAIVMAYTGVTMLAGDKLDIFYQYVSEKLGHCVMTHELAFPEVQDAITDAAKNDFIELAKGNNASTSAGWISVKDGLPEKTERYMCLCYDFVTKSYWHELLWYENNCWWKSLATLEYDYKKHVVYWMPLPEPPKEE